MHRRVSEGTERVTPPPERARDLMSPGVLALPLATRLPVALRALAVHRVHAVLVVDFDGRPRGWLPAHRTVSLPNVDRSLAWAMETVGEPITSIDPFATRAEVAEALSGAQVTRLAVQERAGWLPEGVIADLDLAAAAGTDPE